MFPKVAQVDATAVFILRYPFLNSLKVTNVLGYFCKQICFQVLEKITQSGNTGLTAQFLLIYTDLATAILNQYVRTSYIPMKVIEKMIHYKT